MNSNFWSGLRLHFPTLVAIGPRVLATGKRIIALLARSKPSSWNCVWPFLPTLLLFLLTLTVLIEATILYWIGPFSWPNRLKTLGPLGELLYAPLDSARFIAFYILSGIDLVMPKDTQEALGIVRCTLGCWPTLGSMVVSLLGCTFLVWRLNAGAVKLLKELCKRSG